MRITDWLDSYEIRARIAPTIIVFSPIAILAILIWPDLFSSLNLVLGETALLIFLMYALSFLIRHYGKKIEPNLWSYWGGAPSTRFLRWQDSTFTFMFKEKVHVLLKNQFKISLLSKDMEEKNPIDRDKQIAAAFLQVKSYLYRNDPEGLWKKHNMEYGFNRNLLGSRWIWLIFSIIGTTIFTLLWIKNGETFLFLGIMLSSIEVICSIIVGWHFLPSFVKEAADRYAESVWTTFSVITEQDKHSGDHNVARRLQMKKPQVRR